MVTKLKNLKITSVDLVEQGANPDAHIKLYKSKSGQGEKPLERNTLLERLMQRLAVMAADYLKEGAEQQSPAGDSTAEISTTELPPAKPQEEMKHRLPEGAEDVISLEDAQLTARERRFLRELAEKYGKKTSEQRQVAKARAELHQMKQELQRGKMLAIAKEYALLGKSAETLCDALLELESSSPQGYQTLLDTLEEEKLLIEKSGIFSEIGKRGEKGGSVDGWRKIMEAADRLQKENPALTRASAIQRACEDYPQFVADYEETL